MKRIVTGVLVFFLLFCGTMLSAHGKENAHIRVCLSQNSYSAVFQITEGSYFLQDVATSMPIASLSAGDTITVNQAGNALTLEINSVPLAGGFSGPVRALPEDESELNVFSYKNTKYRDGISIGVDSGHLLVINNIDIEHYLYGVVGKEIGYTAPGEALKAQAVVSRSYALCALGQGLKYDVGADMYSQIYGGYSAEQNFSGEKVIDAVDDTEGEVIYYYNQANKQKSIIKAFFHSNAGGYTENSENVWNEALPYLKAVPSPDDAHAVEYSDETGDSWPASCYHWEMSFSLEEIQAAIDNYLQKTSNPVRIGSFQEIKLYRLNRDGITPTASGRVTKMEIVGSNGSFSVLRDGIRSVFGLKSTKFDVVSGAGGNFVIKDGSSVKHQVDDIGSLKIITGENNVVDLKNAEGMYQVLGESGKTGLNKSVQSITFIGQGNGHGIGMSQWGARGMAEKGSDYQEIIEHYYNQDKYDGSIMIDEY
ncbi:SpoIID/LytB domain-containing protein [Candidatus Formimonas warabiya]|uniref:SpoIID/LytB domain-containing protein n=1 Tax=Formimonas warabiya TaxID=1761012 RepID=UPI0011D149F8|nr:SpoIID/LytB domain-containing protein [Candidatus Formimonas warabiya]